MKGTLRQQVARFSGDKRITLCRHKHKLQGTGAVFFQSVGLLQCAKCRGWQKIEKGIK